MMLCAIYGFIGTNPYDRFSAYQYDREAELQWYAIRADCSSSRLSGSVSNGGNG
jgi:hypothetical protein